MQISRNRNALRERIVIHHVMQLYTKTEFEKLSEARSTETLGPPVI